MFHLMEVECLGACANAPMMQISHGGGDEYFVRAPSLDGNARLHCFSIKF